MVKSFRFREKGFVFRVRIVTQGRFSCLYCYTSVNGLSIQKRCVLLFRDVIRYN